MAFASVDSTRSLSAKVVIAGEVGVGKTTFVETASEIDPVRTEASTIEVAPGARRSGPAITETTTVAMDFGRITVETGVVLFLFGTPGHDRFGFLLDDLCDGAAGVLVLVDSRRIDDCYAAVDYFEEYGIPFVVAVNQFDGSVEHDLDEVRTALRISEEVPLVRCDARDVRSVNETLDELLELVLEKLSAAV
jgi:signal recognition particle receptor subunit beta